ncbi:lmo0937 family membrane protein [Clostridium sp. CF012]|uniref:lmo0937 family membrane protein n=1 Tax=Clostridium sp. CF012 TaxID=2843319 RepID=UPI001C0E1EB6|nr:lmo0937 family membrane protein [Clostridium sp. CF012]MBU3143617.1 lmo0937 family membrane protein [Clostridium sp. CF012]
MGFLRWIGGIVVFFWALGLIFKIGGSMIHLLLVVAAIVFIVDMIFGRRKIS